MRKLAWRCTRPNLVSATQGTAHIAPAAWTTERAPWRPCWPSWQPFVARSRGLKPAWLRSATGNDGMVACVEQEEIARPTRTSARLAPDCYSRFFLLLSNAVWQRRGCPSWIAKGTKGCRSHGLSSDAKTGMAMSSLQNDPLSLWGLCASHVRLHLRFACFLSSFLTEVWKKYDTICYV